MAQKACSGLRLHPLQSRQHNKAKRDVRLLASGGAASQLAGNRSSGRLDNYVCLSCRSYSLAVVAVVAEKSREEIGPVPETERLCSDWGYCNRENLCPKDRNYTHRPWF